MEVAGVIENGKVVLPASVTLPEGTRVRVVVDDTQLRASPLERDALTWDDVEADLRMAEQLRFRE